MATALRQDLAADHDLAAEMRELGERARAAAHILATTPRVLKDQALLRRSGQPARPTERNPGRQRQGHGGGAGARPAGIAARPPGAGCGAGSRRWRPGSRRSPTLEDPVGAELARWQRPNGLDIARVRVPLGVIGVIYELRPNVTADAGALCLKAGNAAILRGGSESFFSSRAILGCLQEGLRAGRAARSRHAVRADHRPRGGRHHADDDRFHRRDRAARRPVADRTGAAGKPHSGVRAPRRHLPRLSARRRRRPRWRAGSCSTPRCAAPRSAARPRPCWSTGRPRRGCCRACSTI